MIRIHIFIIGLLLSIKPLEAYTETEIQNILEKNEKIYQADSELNIVYSILKEFLLGPQKESLIEEQRAWIKKRNQALMEDALYHEYTKRIQTLKSRILEKEESIITQIITAHPIINKTKALNLLSDCPTLNCQAYTIYFEIEKLSNDEERKKAIERKLLTLLSKLDSLHSYEKLEYSTLGDALSGLFSFRGVVVPHDREQYANLEIPLWLVLEHPEILDYDTETCYNPYGINVLAETSIDKLPSYKSFDQSLNTLFVGNWDSGTLYRTFYSNQRRMLDFLSFAPEKFALPNNERPHSNFTLINTSLERWAFLGPWNFIKYNTFKLAFEKMAHEIKNYYESHNYLKKYAPFATNYLNAYIHYNFDCPIEVASNKAYEVFCKPGQSLNDLKKRANFFSKDDWNAALSYAILNNYDLATLEWLIQSGADIHASVDGETFLIKAADHPEILKFLITKGVDLERKTGFGKTALYYAIQFDNLISVKLLVENGADLNPALMKDIGKEVDMEYYGLTKVIGFTPLAYSIRYGSKEMTKYLVEKGATLKDLTLDLLKEWINDDKRIETHRKIIESFQKSQSHFMN